MNAYGNDRRVTAHDDGSFTVVATRRIEPRPGGMFALLPVEEWNSPDFHESADEAIHALIGDPQ